MNLVLVFSLAMIGKLFAGPEQMALSVSLKMEARVAIARGVSYLNQSAELEKVDGISLEHIVWGVEAMVLLQDVENRKEQKALSEIFKRFLQEELKELLEQVEWREKELYRLALICKGILLAERKMTVQHEALTMAKERLLGYMQRLLQEKETLDIPTLSAVWQALHLMMFDCEKVGVENELFAQIDRWIIERFYQRLHEVCVSNKPKVSTNPVEVVTLLLTLSYYPLSPSTQKRFEVCSKMLVKELDNSDIMPVDIRLAQLARAVSQHKSELMLSYRKWGIASVKSLLANQSASGAWQDQASDVRERECVRKTIIVLRLLVEFIR